MGAAWLLGHEVERPLDHLGLVAAGLAQPLHGQAEHLQPGGLGGVGAADGRAAVADDDGRALGGPFVGQGLDDAGRHAGDGRRPLRALGHAVLVAHDVRLELVHAVGVGLEVLLVVGALVEPPVGDGQIERGVGVGQDGDPLVGVHGVAVVAVGGDVDLLDAQLGPPVAEPADQLAAPAPGAWSPGRSPRRAAARRSWRCRRGGCFCGTCWPMDSQPQTCLAPHHQPSQLVGVADLVGVAAEQASSLRPQPWGPCTILFSPCWSF